MALASAPELSVIVPVRNGARTLRGCLEALLASEGVRFEVVVVDDASTDASREVASQFPVSLVRLPFRGGAATARNKGAERARAPILVFVDADVLVAPDTLRRIHENFQGRPNLSALFGSYDSQCPHGDFFSQYKNLHHHYIHQTSRREASTFWTGCGAIRREVFLALGGFLPQEIQGPDLEDIELGYRMRMAGYGIELVPQIQVIHDKPYSFASVLKSDLFHRAIPWTRLMWTKRVFQTDLNTRLTHMASVLVLYISILLPLAPLPIPWKVLGLLVGLGFVTALIWGWVAYCRLERGWSFALRAMFMEWFYLFYSGLGAFLGTLLCLGERLSSRAGLETDWEKHALAQSDDYYLPTPLAQHKGEVTLRLIRTGWGEGGPVGRLLKTDLYEEAFGDDQLLLRPSEPWWAAEVVGIDFSLHILHRARARALALGMGRLRAVCADVRRLPFRGKSFDRILSISTLDHLRGEQDLDDALRELDRAASTRARFFLTMDNPTNPWVVLRGIRMVGPLFRRLGLTPIPLGRMVSWRSLRRILTDLGWGVHGPRHFLHYPRILFIPLMRARCPKGLHRLVSRVVAGTDRWETRSTGPYTGLYYALWAVKGGDVSPRPDPPA
jgi:GT2 family glycosyltransferase